MWEFIFPFCLLPPSIPPIVLYPWLTLMYCMKVEKALERQKYETIARLVIGVVHDKYFVWWRLSMIRLYDFVGITFFSHDILKRYDCFLVCLKYYCFYVNIKLLFWILWIGILIPHKKDYMINMLDSIPHKKMLSFTYSGTGRN